MYFSRQMGCFIVIGDVWLVGRLVGQPGDDELFSNLFYLFLNVIYLFICSLLDCCCCCYFPYVGKLWVFMVLIQSQLAVPPPWGNHYKVAFAAAHFMSGYHQLKASDDFLWPGWLTIYISI